MSRQCKPRDPKKAQMCSPSVMGDADAWELVPWMPSCGAVSATFWLQTRLPSARLTHMTRNSWTFFGPEEPRPRRPRPRRWPSAGSGSAFAPSAVSPVSTAVVT